VAVGSISFSKARVEAFSDGVFAIAITLLVLGFQVPQPAPSGDASLARDLIAMWPQYVVYAASFATIGIMWMNHHSLFNHTERISHGVMTANLALLMLVSFLPFPTSVLGRHGVTPVAVIYYGLTMVGLSICFNVLGYLASLTPSQPARLLDFLRKRNFWNTAGLLGYAIGVGVAYVAPAWTIALYAAMAAYYLSPAALRGNPAAQAARVATGKG
jgi:TMEM175 potassium channel family protein